MALPGDVVLNRRDLLLLAGAGIAWTARMDASDADFWNRKPHADWTLEEIGRLLNDSPWAKEITPVYTSLPPPADHRPWGETPPIGRGPAPPLPGAGQPRQRFVKAPYQATVRWESAEPIRLAQKIALPAAFKDHDVLGVFLHHPSGRDLGPQPVENLKRSGVLLGTRAVDAAIVQAHPDVPDAFLIGFPKTSSYVGSKLEFSASVGLLALKASFNTREMLYHGQQAL